VTGREARRDMSFGCSSPAPGAPRFVFGHRVGTRGPQVDIEDGALPAWLRSRGCCWRRWCRWRSPRVVWAPT